MFKSLLKKTLVSLLGLFFPLLSPSPVLAQSEFSTAYQVNYTILDNGNTRTKFSITLTNRLSNVYATEFSLSIGSTKLTNVQAYDHSGQLEPRIITGDKTTNLIISFPDKVLGKDQSRRFYLEFDSLDFAHQLGNIWEISIPKLTKSDDLTSYQVTLGIPTSFGQPAFINPQPLSQSSQSGHYLYRFRQEDILQTGISATFGQQQFFDFSLNYHLENPNVYPVKTEIALPPDTAFQQVIYQSLQPQPDNITVDPDGNWLAQYQLSPKQILPITASGSAQIFLQPRSDFPSFDLTDLDKYLQPQKYWEVNNPRIQQLAQELQTPQQIYSYVVNNLIYDYGRLSDTTTRFGAANALDNQDSAICMEFTDLFVALTRAVGTPARAVNGFAYTTNPSLRPLSLQKDVLHAWPEYYDQTQKIWRPVDPTWGNTTGGVDFFSQLDLSHFTFVILGQDSQYPIPAGAYKLDNSQDKDVQINFGQPLEPHQQAAMEINLPQETLAGVSLKGQILLKNTGNIALYNQTVSLKSDHFDLQPNQWLVSTIPPFATAAIDFELPATAFNAHLTDSLTASSDLASAQHSLTLTPAYQFLLFHPLTIRLAITLLLLLILLIIFKLVLRHRRSSPQSSS